MIKNLFVRWVYHFRSNWGGLLCLFLFSSGYIGCESPPDKYTTWTTYKADAASTSYSSLRQITKENIAHLKVAWVFYPKDADRGGGWFGSECNPIIIDTIMYATSQRHRVYAINAFTGKQIWVFDPFNGGQFGRSGGQCRGVAYWKGKNGSRILFTAGHYIFAVDAATGQPIVSFGENGRVNLNIGMRDDPEKITVMATSPGIIYNNLFILGSWSPDAHQGVPGYERAYNVITGELVWTFHTVPQPGDPGYETWPKDAWKYVGGANDWGGMSLDKKRGMVFLATGSPSYDYYGADRIGMNLFGNCVVALDAETGKLIWYFQTVHHDLWDYDLPAPPNLVTIEKDGEKIDAVAQVSKTGFVYILNRETGKPIFPIEERKVPASDVPGEQAWPTQPFPTQPAPISRHYITEEDLSSFSASSHDSLVEIFRKLRYQGIFTPPSRQGTFTMPASTGGGEWGGAAYNPQTGILYVKSNNAPEVTVLKKASEVAKRNFLKHKSLYQAGKAIYASYCASCHGKNRQGVGPYPSLVDLNNMLSRRDALNQIRQGGGKMPSFANRIKGDEERALLVYLYDLKMRNSKIKHSSIHENSKEPTQNKPKHPTDTFQEYVNVSAYRQFRDAAGNPGIKPPWGLLNAINLNTGEFEWRVPVGNIPNLQKDGAPPTGMGGSAGPMVTAGGVVFIGCTRDKKFRAFDKDSGKLLWETSLPGVGSSNPSTYYCDGKQFIAISVSPSKEIPAGCIVAFSL